MVFFIQGQTNVVYCMQCILGRWPNLKINFLSSLSLSLSSCIIRIKIVAIAVFKILKLHRKGRTDSKLMELVVQSYFKL